MMTNAREFLPVGGRSTLPTTKAAGIDGIDSFDYPAVKVGVVGNVTVSYDPSLGAPGLALAKQMLDVVAAPYKDMQTFFGIPGGPVTVIIVPKGGANDGTGGAYHYGCDFTSGNVLYCDATFASKTVNPLQLEIALYVAELSECFMGAQGRGWGCGFSNGEGLSRFLAEYETSIGTLDAFATGPAWAAAGYVDWIGQTEPTDQDATSTGCAIVYLYWLRSVGFTIPQIVQAGGTTLAANYQVLTDRTTAYHDLRAAVTGLSVTTDNPFGAPLQQPGLAVLGTTLHVAWKGIPGDDGIYLTTGNGTNWTPQQRVANVGTSTGPALAALNTTLFMAWKGIDRDQRIFWSSSNGTSWTPQQAVANVGTNVGPKLAVLNGHLYMAWKGIDGDPGIYWSSLTNSTWAPQQRITNVGTAFGPALAVFENRLYAVWRGEFGDETLWWSSFNGTVWAPQKQIPGVASSEGPTLAVYNGALYAVWKGNFSDQRLWWSKFNGTAWAAQQMISGVASSNGPGIATFGNAILAVWKGELNDDRLWWSKFNGTSWAAQQVIPGVGSGANVEV
jgi:hypothetical protein